MSIKTVVLTIPLLLISTQSIAGSTADAAIGGGLGGALGAALGNELGGRDGAVLGGALGGATGAAIATDGNKNNHNYNISSGNNYKAPAGGKGSFCPPGQHKKGRC